MGENDKKVKDWRKRTYYKEKWIKEIRKVKKKIQKLGKLKTFIKSMLWEAKYDYGSVLNIW